MANKGGHRTFGNVRRRESGRWQARYPGPDGRLRSAPRTFDTKKDAEAWLDDADAAVDRRLGGPGAGQGSAPDYARHWIDAAPGLRPRTVELYRWLLGKHIAPYLGSAQLGKFTTAAVASGGPTCSLPACRSRWRPSRTAAARGPQHGRGRGQDPPANPCRVRGADRRTLRSDPLTVAQVFALADPMPSTFPRADPADGLRFAAVG